MTATVTASTDNPLVFQSLEYCDACSSAAGKYRVWVDRYRITDDGPKSLDIVLCGHHLNRHSAALAEAGYEIDEI